MIQNIINKIKPVGFISDYLTYASALTDAPAEFHLGAGLTILSTACGSHVVYPGFGGRKCWPNLYTLLIAPSGLFRKSTCLGIAEDILQAMNSSLVLTGEQTREKFLALMKNNPNILYPISEFSSMLSLWQRDYNAGMRELVTDLYDNRQEYQRQTIKEGVLRIKQPALNILAASTIDWLREKLTEGDLRGGLMGRFLMIPGINKSEDKGLTPKPDDAQKALLISFLGGVHHLVNSWVDVRPCLADFNSWVRSTESRLEREDNADMVGFLSRIGAHTLKLSVLFTVSEFGAQEKYELTPENLSRGIRLGTWLKDRAAELAMTGLIKSKFEQTMQKFLTMARRNGGVPRADALYRLHLNVREFDSLVGAALERGHVAADKEPTAGRRNRPAIIYRSIDVKEVPESVKEL